MSQSSQTAPAPAAAGPAVGLGVLVDVVVLTNDLTLFASTREAVGERNPVWRGRSADEAADLLLTGRCGVLLVDMDAVSTRADTLIVQIVEQFPDLVVCVAGSRDDEPMLVPLISEGLVYRFMHKPLTARRAGMFLQAAMRRHVERRDGLDIKDPLAPLMRRLARPPAPMKWFYLATVIAAVALALGYQMPRIGTAPAVKENTPSATEPVATVPLANPVLSRARAALAAGRYEAPAGRNALDLFQAVLLEQPGHVEAQAGRQQTVAHIIKQARIDAAAGRRDAADRLVKRVLSVESRQPEALALARELHPPATPSRHLVEKQLAEAQRAAVINSNAPAASAAPTKGLTADPVAVAVDPNNSNTNVTIPVSRAVVAQAMPVTQANPQLARVMPDPLAPKFSNEPTVRSSAALPAKPMHKPPAYRGPTPPKLAIAGYVRDTGPPVSAAALETETARNLQYLPVDQLNRIEARDPVYPRQALIDRTRGWVELEFTITGSGTVRDVTVIDAEPSGVFDRAAIDALAAWRFRPRLVDGQPALQRSSIKIRFDVDD